ncbi:kinetochore protein Spc25 [Pholidichthys leucotaenia]
MTMSITDPNVSDWFTSRMEEVQKKHLEMYTDIIDTTAELVQSYRQFLESAQNACLKKCKDDEMLFETTQALKKDLERKNEALKQMQCAISEMTSETQEKLIQKDNFIKKIMKLGEEQAKIRELIESQNKENKVKLKNLGKARLVFQNHLGLEIRLIYDKTEPSKGKKVQFIFRNINPRDLDSAYIVTMGIDETRSYHIVSSDPVLDCLPVLGSRLRETNNLQAFLANVRKEFISLSRF